MIVKEKETAILNHEEFVKGLIGKFIHATVNEHISQDPLDKKDVTVNAWFAGKVAGYEKTIFAYDYRDDSFYEEPQTIHKILLCDGMAYALSETSLEIKELTELEFVTMVAEHEVREARKSSLILP